MERRVGKQQAFARSDGVGVLLDMDAAWVRACAKDISHRKHTAKRIVDLTAVSDHFVREP